MTSSARIPFGFFLRSSPVAGLGSPSPDSDYDARFPHARHRDWYLSIDARRDVIEYPIADMLDINGWNMKKVAPVLLKANPVLSVMFSDPLRGGSGVHAPFMCPGFTPCVRALSTLPLPVSRAIGP